MFLKVAGVTGEAVDADHKGEIDITSWSWGMQASVFAASGLPQNKGALSELHVVKRVDQSSPTLMNLLRNHARIKQACLSVRKAGEKPLEYFKIEIEAVRLTSLQTASEGEELVERVTLSFQKIRVSYTRQDATGAKGGGANVFETESNPGS